MYCTHRFDVKRQPAPKSLKREAGFTAGLSEKNASDTVTKLPKRSGKSATFTLFDCHTCKNDALRNRRRVRSCCTAPCIETKRPLPPEFCTRRRVASSVRIAELCAAPPARSNVSMVRVESEYPSPSPALARCARSRSCELVVLVLTRPSSSETPSHDPAMP